MEGVYNEAYMPPVQINTWVSPACSVGIMSASISCGLMFVARVSNWRFSTGTLPLAAPVFHPSSGFGGAALKSDGCRWRGTRLDLAIGILSLGK